MKKDVELIICHLWITQIDTSAKIYLLHKITTIYIYIYNDEIIPILL